MILGITGGIGSGKSTVSLIFDLFGVRVYNSDRRAKELMATDRELVNSIRSEFGAEAYNQGVLNTDFLADVVFNSPQALKTLNSLVHPVVSRDFNEWCLANKGNTLAKEAAILVESGAYRQCDAVVVVDAPEDVRVRRVMERDGVPEHAIKSRMKNQMNPAELRKYADFMINNSGDELLIPQVKSILDKVTNV